MESMKKGGILYVFPLFHTAPVEQKIRHPPADDLFRVSLGKPVLIGGSDPPKTVFVILLKEPVAEFRSSGGRNAHHCFRFGLHGGLP